MEYSFWDHMMRLRKQYARMLEPVCREWTLTRNELDVMLFLANNPGLDTARDICACRGLKPGIVSLNVENLTAGGYITRQSVPGDRRKCRLVCTPKAEPIVSRGRALQEAFFARMTEGVPHGDLEACLRCFAAFDQNLTRIAAEAAT